MNAVVRLWGGIAQYSTAVSHCCGGGTNTFDRTPTTEILGLPASTLTLSGTIWKALRIGQEYIARGCMFVNFLLGQKLVKPDLSIWSLESSVYPVGNLNAPSTVIRQLNNSLWMAQAKPLRLWKWMLRKRTCRHEAVNATAFLRGCHLQSLCYVTV